LLQPKVHTRAGIILKIKRLDVLFKKGVNRGAMRGQVS